MPEYDVTLYYERNLSVEATDEDEARKLTQDLTSMHDLVLADWSIVPLSVTPSRSAAK